MHSELRLLIGSKWYLVTPLSPNPITGPAWRLTKLDLDGKFAVLSETHYDVAVMHGIATCTCGDAHWRRDRKGECCKHAFALAEASLLPRGLPNVEEQP